MTRRILIKIADKLIKNFHVIVENCVMSKAQIPSRRLVNLFLDRKKKRGIAAGGVNAQEFLERKTGFLKDSFEDKHAHLRVVTRLMLSIVAGRNFQIL